VLVKLSNNGAIFGVSVIQIKLSIGLFWYLMAQDWRLEKDKT
jgi:hypothetical protein